VIEMNKIDEFLEEYKTEKHTVQTYKMHLNSYFKYLKTNPDTYFKQKRDYLKDFKDFCIYLRDKYAPLTQLGRLNCVMLFLEENNHRIIHKEWKKLKAKIKGKRARTIDVAPTNQELKGILSHGDIMMKAIALLSSSSGMRMGEILALEPKNIDINHDPVKIILPGEITKTGESRYCFASNEFKEAYMEWMRVRDEFVKRAIGRSKSLMKVKDKSLQRLEGKNPNDKRIFPYSHGTIANKWYRMLQKSGNSERDISTEYYQMHLHTLRKFFETRMSNAGVPDAIYQQLEGHEGYLDASYKRYTPQDIINWYKKGVISLLVFEYENKDVSDIREQLSEKDREIQKLKSDMEKLMKYIEFKRQEEEMEK